MPMMRWTVVFEVDESWVADGFDLTDERAQEMIQNDLLYSYGHETGAKVIASPSKDRIKYLQGTA